MEVLGGIASALALLEAAGKATKAAVSLYQTVHHAPTQLEDLAVHLKLVHELLKRIIAYESKSDSFLASSDLLSLASSTFKSINEIVARLEKSVVKYKGKNQINSRLKLALVENDKIEMHLGQLHRIESGLGLLLQSISIHGHSVVVAKMDSMEQAFNKQFEAMNLQNRWHDQKTPLNPHIGKKAQATSSLWAQINWMGFNFTIAKTQRSNCHDFTLRLRTGIPFAEYIFQLEYSFRKYAFCGLMSPLPSGGYGFSRVIADDSEFMAACLSGDLAVVKDLCRNGSARLDDVSKKNMTPLMYAVEGGDVDTVAFLLDNGASPNWLGGSRQTSPIQWAIKNDRLDIARILIQRGADLHHVSTLGWTPLFYCWAQLYANQSKKTDILKLLAEYSCLELEVLDTKEWTVLQRASAFGTAEDVNVLLKLGANPFTKTTGLQWQGIHYAIAAGNQTTFEELLPKYASEDLQVVDERGWSLLHIAAQAGHQSLIRALLDNGADPYAKSKPTRFYVPEELCDRTCTPGDVACGMDSAIQRRYLDVLAEFSLLAQPCADPSDETGEVFFDAVE